MQTLYAQTHTHAYLQPNNNNTEMNQTNHLQTWKRLQQAATKLQFTLCLQYIHLFSISRVCAGESTALRGEQRRENAEINTQSETLGVGPCFLFSFLSCLSISEFLILWCESCSASQLFCCWNVWLMLHYNLISNIVQKHQNNNSCQNSNSRQSHKSLTGRRETSPTSYQNLTSENNKQQHSFLSLTLFCSKNELRKTVKKV